MLHVLLAILAVTANCYTVYLMVCHVVDVLRHKDMTE